MADHDEAPAGGKATEVAGGKAMEVAGGKAVEVDKELIRELAALLEETGLSEIEVSNQGRTIRVARGGNAAAPAPAPAAAAEPRASAEDLSNHPGAVTSPMVGIVYVAPAPDAPPFVKVGDKVAAGQTVFIVEAMKTMNPIPAPRDGTVARILATPGAPVEFGEVLMILD